METSGTASGDATPFVNEPIAADGLPQLHAQPFEPLDPAYARVRLSGAAIGLAVVVVVTVAGSILASSRIPLVLGGILAVFVILIGIAHRVETDHMGYLVREHDVSFCSGVIGRSVATAPFARVQHVSIERGPIDRWFGLARLQLRTAGGHIAIPGLRHDVAERLKELVAVRAGTLADAEIEDGDETVVTDVEQRVEPDEAGDIDAP